MPEFRPQAKVAALFAVFLITGMLYLGKEFLMPLALAVLITFLLAPLAARLEKWRFRRIPSVLLTVAAAFLVAASAIYVMTDQFLDLAGSMPRYKQNLSAKLAVLRDAGHGPLSRAAGTFEELSKEAAAGDPPPNQERAVAVQVVPQKPSLPSLLFELIGPVLKPLGTASVVIVLVIFMLLERTDLRDRFIHLVGRGRLHLTTEALDDAASRVSRYLGAQLLVNLTYGAPVAVGLYFIGIPNAVLWGLLATMLRFVPYLGPMIAAVFPIALSFAIAPDWGAPVATITLFVVIELISNNVFEPWLYGASTGLSPIAIIISAIFWAWLWGAGGLLLATPLTVCAAVLGKYVPGLQWLDVLLGDRPPIRAEDRFYQRVIAGDLAEITQTIERHVAKGQESELIENVILPTLRQIDEEYERGIATREEREEYLERMREALHAIDGYDPASAPDEPAAMIFPARTESDELAAGLVAYLLGQQGVAARAFSHRALSSEMIGAAQASPDVPLCIIALTPTAARAGSGLIRRLGPLPRLPILAVITEAELHIDTTHCEVVRTMHAAIPRLTCSAPSLAAAA
jgi:predicted PurR-regulated permease PerM